MSLILIFITVLISFYCFENRTIYSKLLFNPYNINKRNEWYRFFSHVFVHADFSHLLFNMFTAYFFLPTVATILEIKTGNSWLLLILYFSASLVSSIPDYIKQKENIYYSAVGASGSISAVLFAFIYFLPFHTIYLYFIPVPAIVFAVLYVGYSFYMAKRNIGNVGHTAHLSGAIYGLCFAFIIDLLF